MGNLILIGFMGCGKSTLGIQLSYRLRKPFLDTDRRIEERQGSSISDLFSEKGEAFFRGLETDALKELLLENTEYVISTGGGIILNPKNREILKELGTVVYLKVSPQTVYGRLKHDKTRPLLQGENPLAKIEGLMQERSSLYEEAAQVIIEADGKSIEELTEEISEAVK